MRETQVGKVLSYMKHKKVPCLDCCHRGKQSMCSSPEAASMSVVISPVGFSRERKDSCLSAAFIHLMMGG